MRLPPPTVVGLRACFYTVEKTACRACRGLAVPMYPRRAEFQEKKALLRRTAPPAPQLSAHELSCAPLVRVGVHVHIHIDLLWVARLSAGHIS